MLCLTKKKQAHITQHHSLTRSTPLPSSVPSWPPLENLQVRLHSSRYSCLWRGTHSRSYTELVPDPPDTDPRKTCHCRRLMCPAVGLTGVPEYLARSPCRWCLALCPSASDSKPRPRRTAPAPSGYFPGFRWLLLLQAGHQLSYPTLIMLVTIDILTICTQRRGVLQV